jgi:hypothetical protein
MHCELIVPGLLSPSSEGVAQARHPALELLLARGRREAADSLSLEQWLHDAFEQAGDTLAAGALTLASVGDEPGDAWWARADPVHLRVLRDRAVVVPGEALDLRAEEVDALVASLNAHFGSLSFRAIAPRRWVVRLAEETPGLDSPALVAAGRDAASARGGQALLTEIQMLLHAHPVNEAREARGEPAVNSLWLWGGGRMPLTASGPWRSVTANDPAVLGLARLAGMQRRALPTSAESWLQCAPGSGRHLIVLDAVRAAAALEQQAEHEEGVTALDRDWFAPLLIALRTELIGMVSVHVPAPGASFETARGDLRRFWRRPRPVASYA